MKHVLLRKPVVSWALYDWANSAFATTVMAGFFPVFYSALSQDIGEAKSLFWFKLTLAGSSAIVAIAAPLLGAVADRCGGRKKFLASFAMIGVLMSAGLAWVHAGQWWVGLLLYGLGTVGFSGANIFYDALLTDVSEEQDFDLVSAFGYAMGYMGGGLLFALNVWMVLEPQTFGFEDPASAIKASFITVAVWWTLFSIPLLVVVREAPTADRAPRLRDAVRQGVTQLRDTFREIRQMRVVLFFLAGYWLYIDGVNTVIKTAVLFAKSVLDLPQGTLVSALLVTQFVAFPAALGFGWLGKRIGPRPAILIGLMVYVFALVFAWGWLATGRDFYVLAVTIGLVQGGVQSLSRSLFARIIPVSKTTEFFGFFNMVGKSATILGPLLMAAVPIVFGAADERDSILALCILFVGGGLLLWRVDVQAGSAAAARMDEQSSTP